MSGLFHRRKRPPGTNLPGPQAAAANRRDWREYDAEAFEHSAVRLTGAAAGDLVELVSPPRGCHLLDVGTGTGVAGAAAGDAVGPDGVVVGADISFDMVHVGTRERPRVRFVVADAVDLPFPNESFDVVTANFLIALVPTYDTVLFDMIRVLTPGGRLGLTWWGKGEDEFQRRWRALCEEAVGQEMLDDAVAQIMPGDERFADRASFEQTLRDAGLHPVRIEPREYRIQMSRQDYLLHRSTSATGRFVHGMLGEDGWEAFMHRAQSAFADEFPEQVNDFRDVNLAVGTKAADGLQQQDVQGSRR